MLDYVKDTINVKEVKTTADCILAHIEFIIGKFDGGALRVLDEDLFKMFGRDFLTIRDGDYKSFNADGWT